MKIEAFPNVEPMNVQLCSSLYDVLGWRYFDKDDLKIQDSIKIILDEKEIIYLKGLIDTLSNVRFEEADTLKSLEIIRSLTELIDGLKKYRSLILMINHDKV